MPAGHRPRFQPPTCRQPERRKRRTTMSTSAPRNVPDGMEIRGPVTPEYDDILTPEALAFVAKLERAFRDTRAELLRKRAERQAALDAGALPDFLPETAEIRAGSWTIAPT